MSDCVFYVFDLDKLVDWELKLSKYWEWMDYEFFEFWNDTRWVSHWNIIYLGELIVGS